MKAEFRRVYSDFNVKYHLASKEIGKVVVGLDHLIRDAFTAILGKGHLLVVSSPGLGKTTVIETLASVIDARCVKLTFNANLMPDELTHIASPHEIGLRIDRGPLLDAEIFFANELNRGPEKTQSYMMSAMEEGESYYRGELVKLPAFRFVVADINPVETTGTYQIPEALAERFLLKTRIDFPSSDMLAQITASSEDRKMRPPEIAKVFTTKELSAYAETIFELYRPYFHENSWPVRYAGALVSWIRNSGYVVPDVDGVPASPSVRGAEDLKTVSRLYAFFDGEPVVMPHHVKEAAYPALRGKFFLNSSAMAKEVVNPDGTKRKLTHDDVIAMALDRVPITASVP